MPRRRLGRRHRQLVGVLAKGALYSSEFDRVGHGRRAVGVHIVDLVGIELAALQRRLHGSHRAVAVLGGRGDVIGVAGQAITDDFGVDLGVALLGVLVFL